MPVVRQNIYSPQFQRSILLKVFEIVFTAGQLGLGEIYRIAALPLSVFRCDSIDHRPCREILQAAIGRRDGGSRSQSEVHGDGGSVERRLTVNVSCSILEGMPLIRMSVA